MATRLRNELDDITTDLRQKLKDSKSDNERLQFVIDELRKEVQDLNTMIGDQKTTIDKLESRLDELKKKKVLLSFDSLRPGGVLGKYVKDYTFFLTDEVKLRNRADAIELGRLPTQEESGAAQSRNRTER